jgi:hypothetical protein
MLGANSPKLDINGRVFSEVGTGSRDSWEG